MGNAWKAALLSGLVFPGLGQIMLRHYRRGIAFIFTVFISLSVIVVKGTRFALTILDKIESEGRVIDIDTISNAAAQALAPSDKLTYNFVLLSIILCWIVGMIDAYRLGKKKDMEQSRSPVSNRSSN